MKSAFLMGLLALLITSVCAADTFAQRPLRRIAANATKNAVQEVTDKDFKTEVEDSKIPVLVDFYAPWCGPCKAIAPLVEKAAGQYAGKLKVVKLNTDNSPNTMRKFGVRSIPTLIFFKDGKVVKISVGGGLSYKQLTDLIDEVLK